jgi:hypothetical protein
MSEPKRVGRTKREARLEAENQALRQRVSELEDENELLEYERDELLKMSTVKRNRNLQTVVEAAKHNRNMRKAFVTNSEYVRRANLELDEALETLEEEPCECVFVVKLPDGENAHIHSSECPKCQPPADKE